MTFPEKNIVQSIEQLLKPNEVLCYSAGFWSVIDEDNGLVVHRAESIIDILTELECVDSANILPRSVLGDIYETLEDTESVELLTDGSVRLHMTKANYASFSNAQELLNWLIERNSITEFYTITVEVSGPSSEARDSVLTEILKTIENRKEVTNLSLYEH